MDRNIINETRSLPTAPSAAQGTPPEATEADSNTQLSNSADQSRTHPLQRLFRKYKKLLYEYVITPFSSSRKPPWHDARGTVVGLWVGFAFPVGTQCVLMLLLRTIFRYNIIIAFAVSWVSNPFTMVPMYYGYYCLGSLVLGQPASLSHHAFSDLIHPVMHAGYFWDTVPAFLALGWDFLKRWLVAGVSLAAITSPFGYFLTYRVQTKRCRNRAQKLGITYENLIKEMEERAEREDKEDWVGKRKK